MEGNELKCSRCGAGITNGQQYCPGCGGRIVFKLPDLTCQKCGNVWTPRKLNPKNCPGCGFRLDKIIAIREVQNFGRLPVAGICQECDKETGLISTVWEGTKDDRKTVCHWCFITQLEKEIEEDTTDWLIQESEVKVDGDYHT